MSEAQTMQKLRRVYYMVTIKLTNIQDKTEQTCLNMARLKNHVF
jgi:hypothetical protein